MNQLPLTRGLFYTGMISLALAFPLTSTAQVIGNWNFNNTTSGTGSIYNTVSAASFSASVPSTAFNGGTEYYGHNGWPTGTLDPAYYLQFTLTPTTGYALNILSLVLRIRHSNTGPSGGSGPTRFTLRSSLDGYASNISTGNVTGSYGTFTITPGAGYNNLPIAVSFRIYGHDAVLYSGGNNRLVFDNIDVNAIGIVLPHTLVSFTGAPYGNGVKVNYRVNNNTAGTRYTIERSEDANRFSVVSSRHEEETKAHIERQFYDEYVTGKASKLYYRLLTEDVNGNLSLSPVISVSRATQRAEFTVSSAPGSVIVRGIFPDHCAVVMYNTTGIVVDSKTLRGNNDIRSVAIGNKTHLPSGIYYISITPGAFLTQSIFIR